MNSSNREEDFTGNGGGGIENVSRSGRVRKKNTLLAGFESLDPLEKPKKKSEKRPKEHPAKVTLKFGGDALPLKKAGSKKPLGKRMKITGGSRQHHANSKPSHRPFLLQAHEEGDLEIDLPSEYEDDMPILAQEDIIDESLLDADDHTTEITSINKLKSQAQSTYMMEKSFEKNRKSTSLSGTPGKTKAARKDKGNPRVTAYMLWAKDQRAIFAKKYPHLDFSSLSKKLSELWATVPQNQKKMWKNKATKIMRKNSNVMENIKNSGPLPPPIGKGKKSRGRPRIHPVNSDNEGLGVVEDMSLLPPPPAKGPHSTKGPVRKPGGNFLSQSEKKKSPNSTNAPSKQLNWKNQPAKSNRNSKPGNNNITVGPPKSSKPKPKVQLAVIESKFPAKNNFFAATPSTSFSLSSSKQLSPRKDDESIYKVTGTTPMDVAAHFALLGESLSIIGERLKDVEGQTVSGSLSVLLDSLLCATGPLLCLSQQVPELNCIPQEKLAHLLDNIAYVMPGL